MQCPLCSCTRIQPYSVRVRPNALHFLRMRCQQCQLIFALPRRSTAELSDWYQNYYTRGNFSDWKRKISPDSIASTPRYLERVHRHMPNGRWLEVGAGLGQIALAAQRKGYNVVATELDSDAARFMQDVMGIQSVMMGDLVNIYSSIGQFNIVSMHHVLEHVPDLNQTLSAVHSVLIKNGLFCIAVPNLDNIGYHVLRRSSFLCGHIPDIVDGIEHTLGFGPRSLTYALNKHGFTVQWISTFAKPFRLRPATRMFDSLFRVRMECIATKQ